MKQFLSFVRPLMIKCVRISYRTRRTIDLKAKKLNTGAIIKPDEKLKAVFPVKELHMLKMGSFVKKHILT